MSHYLSGLKQILTRVEDGPPERRFSHHVDNALYCDYFESHLDEYCIDLVSDSTGMPPGFELWLVFVLGSDSRPLVPHRQLRRRYHGHTSSAD